VSDADLDRQHHPLMSPLVWDLGHIAAFEDLWLCRETGLDLLRADLADLYDADETPRSERGHLPYPRRAEATDYMRAVRERALDHLDAVSPFVREMLVQHEHQHNETMLQTLQLAEPGVYSPPRARRDGEAAAGAIEIEAGPFELGDGGHGFAYDNERPRHTVELESFWIDRAPVTNAAYAEFIAETGREPPMYWESDGDGWWVRTAMGRREPVDPALPVVHVSWHEADAFARWAGKRLPTEFEWEAAARGADPDRANLDQLAFGCARVGAYGDAPCECGAIHMLGDVWEWTSSDFRAYPGFEAFPYREYSEVFFGDTYKVLRGGAWATRRDVIRTSFRNWDLPIRRQIFSGIRCARND
jgi:gamma-glutamyl hercynylcysteine S-oxide synthase